MPRCRKDNKHLRGEEWQKLHGTRFRGQCIKCGTEGKKSDFIPLYVRMSDYDSHRILARFCPQCLMVLAAELKVKLPE